MAKPKKTLRKRLKNRWSVTTPGRVLRGIFGPSRTTLEAAKNGLSKQRVGTSGPRIIDESVKRLEGMTGKRLTPEQRMLALEWSIKRAAKGKDMAREEEIKVIRTKLRMGAKYSMDALNVRDPEKRDSIYALLEGQIPELRARREAGHESIRPLSVRELNREIKEELGAAKGKAFIYLLNRKMKKIKRYI
ncbi:MAG: hypothetical protein JXB14_05450 [Candidatus Altiarchaeota archaeon]|nr:hypothetical protein [Candidatus Altiarchaeota archaeon]